MFVDEVNVHFKAGGGGDGAAAFGRNGKPNGGDGGDGGDIYLEGSTDVYDLSFFSRRKKFTAGQGRNGDRERARGANGEDLVLKVPLVTVVKNSDSKELLKISRKGERELLVKGGRGGLGNYYFRRGQVRTLKKTTPGKVGEESTVTLDLRLKADVVLIGLPNAGKSSLLNALSNATVKVAAYPFTTLEPNLGVSGDLVLLDLPGLIEGSYKGKGLGTEFTKHIGEAKLIAHLVSLENEDLNRAYKLVRRELKEIDPGLSRIKELVILTKSDLFSPELVKQAKATYEKLGKRVTVLSIKEKDSLKKINTLFTRLIKS